MKKLHYRLYGDNIIECIRIVKMIKNNSFENFQEKLSLINQMSFIITLKNNNYELIFELVPGFEKSNKKRWRDNILNNYKTIGSVLDETADAFITKIDKDIETILCVIEFCSALQAGNQAWQRSGRAYSCARTKIPYFYIIDLPKYELNPATRERLALRFPNCIVPYSYITYSEIHNTTAYVLINKSQEYIETDPAFDGYDMSTIFNDKEFGNYLLHLILGKNTEKFVESIKIKNSNFVNFLAPLENVQSYTGDEIHELNPEELANSIITNNKKFSFKKKIAKKSISGNLNDLHNIVQKYSLGIFSSDLPFGIIEKNKIIHFVEDCSKLYPLDKKIKKELLKKEYLIVTMIKGFKPGGDDNRPDRGILPLIRMLFGEQAPVLTILYGPLLKNNYKLLTNNPKKLSKSNGLWQTIIELSNYLLFDCPIIKEDENKSGFIVFHSTLTTLTNIKYSFKKLDLSPQHFREDDIDSLFYLLFSYESDAFYGICNPPGGDWSGLSLIFNNTEYRWLSLPRVSNDKRPDHVIEFDINGQKPFLLIMESKEKACDLEENIGYRLSNYVKWLLSSIPNVEYAEDLWKKSNRKLSFDNFQPITCGSFISTSSINYSNLLETSNCDIIYSCIPQDNKWKLEIYYKNNNIVSEFIEKTKSIYKNSIFIFDVKFFAID